MEDALESEFRILFFTFISQAPNINFSAAIHRAVVCLDLECKSVPATAEEDPEFPPDQSLYNDGNHGLPVQFGATKSTL